MGVIETILNELKSSLNFFVALIDFKKLYENIWMCIKALYRNIKPLKFKF